MKNKDLIKKVLEEELLTKISELVAKYWLKDSEEARNLEFMVSIMEGKMPTGNFAERNADLIEEIGSLVEDINKLKSC